MTPRFPWLACILALGACASSPHVESTYPAQKPGCEVRIFFEDHAPTSRIDNIGSVRASCDQDVSDSDCLRQLQDEACKIGGDTVWGVNEKPIRELGKNKFSGRAAHTH